MGKIEVIGVGLDGTLGLSDRLLAIIQQATILVGTQRLLDYFPTFAGKKILLENLSGTLAILSTYLAQEELIVVLVTGDPLFFGLGRLLLNYLPAAQINFHPHLSSIQLAFSRIKVPWQDSRIISVHGRDLGQLSKILLQGSHKIAVLTDSVNNPQAIARLYLSLSLPTAYDLYICENLGSLTAEKITTIPYRDLNSFSQAKDMDFAKLNVVILLRRDDIKQKQLTPESLPLIGIKDENFLSFSDRPGLMTKKEIRLLILGQLELQTKQVIWDIGAGTGSVSVEIARLSPNSAIYAIEKTAMGVSLIQQNSQSMGINNITVIQGEAPAILAPLPSPDRIFIGGSGGNLSAILNICQTKLKVGGVIVLAFATIENINSSLAWFKAHNWQYSLLQVQISRSLPIANLTRFSPLNPVTIITGKLEKL